MLLEGAGGEYVILKYINNLNKKFKLGRIGKSLKENKYNPQVVKYVKKDKCKQRTITSRVYKDI